jgi:anti-anti-sigma factor
MPKRGLNDIVQLAFSRQGERLTARPEGRMEAADGADLASAVEQRLEPTVRSITIDLAGVEFLNFGAIRAILRLARSLTAGGRELDFLGGSHAVREVLDQAGLDDFFPFSPPYIHTGGNRHETP